MGKDKRELDRGCIYCENASLLQDKDFVLCSYRGVVSAGYSCRRFSYDPLKRVPSPGRSPLIAPPPEDLP